MLPVGPAAFAATKADAKIAELYRKECGACHAPFPAYLLPTRSWDKIMVALHQHFGDNAELSTEHQPIIQKYLTDHAADNKNDRSGDRVMASLGPDEAPQRVTEVKYFVTVHNKVPKKVIDENPTLKGLRDCAACHREAASGTFDEDDVRLPVRRKSK